MQVRTAVRKGLASPAVPDAWRSRSRSARALCAEGAIVLWASCSWLRMSQTPALDSEKHGATLRQLTTLPKLAELRDFMAAKACSPDGFPARSGGRDTPIAICYCRALSRSLMGGCHPLQSRRLRI